MALVTDSYGVLELDGVQIPLRSLSFDANPSSLVRVRAKSSLEVPHVPPAGVAPPATLEESLARAVLAGDEAAAFALRDALAERDAGAGTRSLWLLLPAEGLPDDRNPWRPWYDKAFGLVVSAADEAKARRLANVEGADENRALPGVRPWLRPDYSTCRCLGPTREPEGVLVEDHRSG